MILTLLGLMITATCLLSLLSDWGIAVTTGGASGMEAIKWIIGLFNCVAGIGRRQVIVCFTSFCIEGHWCRSIFFHNSYCVVAFEEWYKGHLQPCLSQNLC